MTTKVTKESLAENIGRLESYGDLSLNEEYQLKAYRLLAVYMGSCVHDQVKECYKQRCDEVLLSRGTHNHDLQSN